MTNNLSAQVSYTYSDCVDISSGDWTQEGGTIIADAYNPNVDRGPCLFMIGHNLTANFLYILPFQKNRLVSGWQVGGILYFATGGPFDVTTFANGSTDIGTVGNNRAGSFAQRARLQRAHQLELWQHQRNQLPQPQLLYGATAGRAGQLGEGCVSRPTASRSILLCRRTRKSRSGSMSSSGRNSSTCLIARITPTRASPLCNRAVAAPWPALRSGSTLPTFGQITSINGTMRQIQFGLKLLFERRVAGPRVKVIMVRTLRALFVRGVARAWKISNQHAIDGTEPVRRVFRDQNPVSFGDGARRSAFDRGAIEVGGIRSLFIRRACRLLPSG